MNNRFDRFYNAFNTLGIKVGASFKEIKSSYRNLAKKIHPDKNRGENESSAHEKFTELRDSYVLLCNESERKRFEEEYASLNNSGKLRRDSTKKAKAHYSLNVNSSKTGELIKGGKVSVSDYESLYRESINLVNLFRSRLKPSVVKASEKNGKQNIGHALSHARVDNIVERFSEFEKIVIFKLNRIISHNQ